MKTGRIFLVMLIALIIMPSALAQIQFGVANKEVRDMTEGVPKTAVAWIANYGACNLICSYKAPVDINSNFVDNLIPYQILEFKFNFAVPFGCKEPCKITINVECTEVGAGCSQVYDAAASFNAYNISAGAKPLDTSQNVSIVPTETEQKPNAAWGIIGIIIILLIFLGILWLILKGMKKLKKSLKKGKRKN